MRRIKPTHNKTNKNYFDFFEFEFCISPYHIIKYNITKYGILYTIKYSQCQSTFAHNKMKQKDLFKKLI